MKKCSKCGVEKPLTDFWKRKDTPDGLSYYCKPCGHADSVTWKRKNPTQQRIINLREKKKNRVARLAYTKNWALKARYGLLPKQRDEMIAAQSNRCAICEKEFSNSRDTHVDHIHGSSPPVVRGILCGSCNRGLGSFKDSFESLEKAAEYLKKFQK